MILKYIFIFSIILLSIGTKAQMPKVLTADQALNLTTLYKGEKVISYAYNTTYNFSYDARVNKIYVNEERIEYYVRLQEEKDLRIIRNDYYSDNTSIESIKGKYWSSSDMGKVQINGIFHHDFYRTKYYRFPCKLNEVSYVRVKKTYSDSRYLTSIFFQLDLPVLQREITFKIPNTVDLELKEFNFNEHAITKEVVEEKGMTIITYKLDTLKPFPIEINAPGRSFYAPHLVLISKGNKTDDLKKKKTILSTTKDQYNWYKRLVDYAMNDSSALIGIVNQINRSTTSDKQRMEKIFYWVQDNIDYIAYEDGIAGFQPENCQNVFNAKYGDCKGMANLMTEMLKLSGIDARRTWIGTNSIAYDYSIPSLAVDNHAICTVLMDGKYYFLDGTEKYIGLGDYAERIQGRQALIENGDSYLIKEVPQFSYERNLMSSQMNFIIEGNILVGNITNKVSGESKVRLLNYYHTMYEEHQEVAKNYLIRGDDNNIHVDKITTSNFENRISNIDIYSEVHIENKIYEFGNELYLDWDLYKEYADFKIDTNRTLDYMLLRKVYQKNEFVYITPAGYQLKKTPENLIIKNDEFSIHISFTYTENNKLTIKKSIIIPNAEISVNNVDAWNEAIDILNEKYYKTAIIYEKI